MEAVSTSETSVYSKTTRSYIPGGTHLHTRRRENLKSHIGQHLPVEVRRRDLTCTSIVARR
jgi:hypothetical protein